MGNQSTTLKADVQKFKGVNPGDMPAGVVKIASDLNNEKPIVSDVIEDVVSTGNIEEHARMTPVPPIGGPRSFISPRTELIGSGNTSLSKPKITDDDLSTMEGSSIATKSSRKASNDPFDFRLTEGQSRRNAMADFETDCTSVTEYLFLGGHKIAQSWDTLFGNGITQVINCSAMVVDNYFIDKQDMKYLSLNMVDGRQDDVAWFLCEVLHFIEGGRKAGAKTLLHCEKGISRSCSFAIAYYMWDRSCTFREAFDYVKSKRGVCNPNTSFTCNLLELEHLFNEEQIFSPLLFRCAEHAAHDENRPVLKLCRADDSRQILTPKLSLLDPRGVFVVRASGATTKSCSQLYIWRGSEASDRVVEITHKFALLFRGIFVEEDAEINVISEGCEPEPFWDSVEHDISFVKSGVLSFSDLFTVSSIAHDDTSKTSSPVKDSTNPNSLSSDQLLVTDQSFGNLSDANSNTSSPAKLYIKPLSVVTTDETASLAKKLGGDIDNSNQKKVNAFVLPIAKIEPEISPSIRERHPEFVDVLRGPVSAEELVQIKRSGTSGEIIGETALVSPEKEVNLEIVKLCMSNSGNMCLPVLPLPDTKEHGNSAATTYRSSEGANFDKPRLFQAVTFDDSGDHFKWLSMGVYDDNDLDEESMFLLILPAMVGNFIWLGSRYKFFGLDDSIRDDGASSELEELCRVIASNVALGELEVVGFEPKLFFDPEVFKLVTSGSEPEEWWNAFADGY